MSEQEQKELIPGVNTHENIIFTCFGGFSNTGVTAAYASLEAVKEVGLKKAGIGCLAALPIEVKSVFVKTKVAKKIITVDGCPQECSKKIVEKAGLPIFKSIVLARDIGMNKHPLSRDIGGDLKNVDEYISLEDVKKAKDIIVQAINE